MIEIVDNPLIFLVIGTTCGFFAYGILGEASKRFSNWLVRKYLGIDWREEAMDARAENKVLHGSFVCLECVTNAVDNLRASRLERNITETEDKKGT